MGASEKFVYDSTGNIIQLDDLVLEYSAGDRLQRRGNTQYVYDGNGRLVKKIEDCESQTSKVWEFSWDAEDQLRKVTTPAGEVWEYKYDALGRRIAKQGPKTTTQFVWNGDVVVHQVENKKVLHSSWVFDPYSIAPLCKVQNEQLYSVICDHLGTPRELLDIEGKVVWSVSYKAWGEVEEIKVWEVECPIRFQGQWVDEENGLHYNRFRYYEAQSGRFVSADLIRLLGGLNSYFYAINSINWLDPFGLSSCENSRVNTRRQALRAAKKRAGIPLSQQPVKQWEVGNDITRIGHKNYVYSDDPGSHGRYYQYETPVTGGASNNRGSGTRVIVDHTNDPNRGRHTHAGRPKGEDGQSNVDMQGERYRQIGEKHHIDYGS